jgi:hypothetical protein
VWDGKSSGSKDMLRKAMDKGLKWHVKFSYASKPNIHGVGSDSIAHASK